MRTAPRRCDVVQGAGGVVATLDGRGSGVGRIWPVYRFRGPVRLGAVDYVLGVSLGRSLT